MKNFLTVIFIIVLSTAIYAGTLKGIAGNVDVNSTELLSPPFEAGPFETSHPRSSFAIVLALDDYNETYLTKELADFASPDVGYFKGKFYSFFPPGTAYTAYPFFLLGKHFNLSQVFAFFSASIFGILGLVFLYKIMREVFSLPIWSSLFGVLVLGFGSTFWNYSITIYQHSPTVFFLMFGFYCVWRFKQQTYWSWLWSIGAWSSYGLSVFFDYPNIIIVFPIVVYLLIVSFNLKEQGNVYKISFRTSIIFTSVALFLFAGLHMYYNQQTLEDWGRFSNTLPRYAESRLAINEGDAEKISDSKQKVNSLFQEIRTVNGVRIVFFSIDKGLFVYSPIFILALFGIYTSRKKIGLELSIMFSIVLCTIFVYTSFGDPWGGWAYGPRYLIPIMPVLAILISLWLTHINYKFISRVIAFVLFVYSAGVALLGAATQNIVIPKIEAVPLNAPYNYFANIKLLKNGTSGVYFYNTYLADHLSLMSYYIIILSTLSCVAFIVLFIAPKLTKDYGIKD